MAVISVLPAVLALTLLVRSLLVLRDAAASPALRAWCRLTQIVAPLALLVHFLVAGGTLVFSPEFGVALMQGGRAAQFALAALLVVVGVGAALCWRTARLYAGRKGPRNAWIVLAGLLFGLAAATRVVLVNAAEAQALQLHRYDLWWPPLQCAVVASGVAAGLAEARLRPPLARAAAIAGTLAAVLVWASYRPAFADAQSVALVRVGGPITLAFWWALAGWIAFSAPAAGAGAPRRDRRWMALPIAGALGLAAAWFVSPANPGRIGDAAWALAALASVPLLLALVRWRALRRALAAAAAGLGWRQYGVLAGVVLAGACLVDLLYGGNLAAEHALVGVLVAWIVLFESLHAGWIGGLFVHAAKGTLSALVEPLRAAGARLLPVATGAWGSLVALLQALFSADSLAVAVLKAIAGVLVLVALSELPNAGRTVVVPIQPPEDDVAFKGSGQDLANHVAASLARLNDELLPDLVVPKGVRPTSPQAQRATSQSASTVEAALAKSGDLKIGPATIPLGALVAPVQSPMRALLGVRVISGSLHVDRDGYTLLAESTAGQSWRVRVPADDGLAGDCDPKAAQPREGTAPVVPMAKPAPAPVPASGAASAAAKAPSDAASVAASGLRPADVVAPMGEELAFNVRREDPALAAVGLTRSWRAFKCFREGLRHWRRFELTDGVEELAPAVRGFREATRIDPAFALAHYRLGLALRSDGQPAQAVESLRASLRASPEFMPATAALASTLWDHDSFLFQTPVPDDDGPEVNHSAAEQARHAQARELWQGLVRSPAVDANALDRAAANYGLCLDTFQRWTEGADSAPPAVGRDPAALADGLLEIYFYCKRSDELQRRLPAPRQADPVARRARGLVLNVLGQLLENSGARRLDRRVEGWHCRLEDDDAAAAPDADGPAAVYHLGPFAEAALGYHRRAAQALPQDTEVACDLARAAATLLDNRPMQRLEQRAEMRTRLADELLGRDDIGAVRRAQREYHAAIAFDPASVEALNGLANAAWKWRRLALESDAVPALDAATLVEAESAARQAVALTASRTDAVKRIVVRSTLGDILIAEGRYHEAVRELDDALQDLGKAARHALFHEVWRDLARAALCAADADDMARLDADAKELRATAAAAMAFIQDDERKRAQSVFVRAGGTPDPLRLPALCARSAGPVAPTADRYVGRQTRVSVPRGCERQWVSAEVHGGGTKGLQVELWGGGPRQKLEVGDDGKTDTVAIAATRRNTHRDYFALLTENGEPRSARLWLETTETRKADDCAGNLLVVDFEPRGAAAPRRE